MRQIAPFSIFGLNGISKYVHRMFKSVKIVAERKGLYRWLYVLAFLAGVVCTGCGSPRGELFAPLEYALVWPGPPEKGRIKYVGSLSTEADLKREVSWSESLGELIFGKKDIGVLLGPYAVAVDEKDRLFVADAPSGLIHVFDLNTREYEQFSSLANNETLLMPVALARVDNYLYVVDSMLHKICVFGRRGNFVFSFGQDRLERPSGIAYWQAKGLIYVSDSASHTISVFDKKGEFETTIGSRGPLAGEFNFPTHLWLDDSGLLYVSDTLNYRIQIFSSDGTFLRMFGRHGDRPGNFAHPCGVATDSLGNIYVTDRQFENIQIFDSDGRILMAFGEEGSGLGQFWLPAGVLIDTRNRIYVADSFNKRIQVFELLEQGER
jgi:DNA-binding beta-propeller fold protein YncE